MIDIIRENHKKMIVYFLINTKANSVQLFRELDWVPFYHEANVSRLSMAYKRLSGDCPSYLSQMLIRNADINERSSLQPHEQEWSSEK